MLASIRSAGGARAAAAPQQQQQQRPQAAPSDCSSSSSSVIRQAPTRRLPCNISSSNAHIPRRRRLVCQSSPGGGSSDSQGAGGGSERPDIDALAKMLSAEAARLRASMDAGASEDSPGSSSRVSTSKASSDREQHDQMEATLFAEVGAGGFDSVDFELVQQLGSIRVQPANQDAKRGPDTAVIVYAARFHPRLAYTRPVPMLLKEYLPLSRPVASNELLLLKHLFGELPEDKYAAAIEQGPLTSPPPAAAAGPLGAARVPVVPLLGYFLSAPSDQAATLSTDDSLDSIWMVYKWEGLRPLGMLMMEGPPQPSYGLLKSRESAEEEAWQGRCEVLRATTSGLLGAVDFCHSADVVHGSLSSGSVLLGRWEELERGGWGASKHHLEVKLDGFGFGKWFVYGEPAAPGGGGGAGAAARRQAEMVAGHVWPASAFGRQGDDHEALEAGKREDLQACALLLTEAFIACLAPGTPKAMRPPPGSREARAADAAEASAGAGLDRAALQRLLFGVFHDDIQQFREYCLQDATRYGRLVSFLDEAEGSGWQLLADLLQGTKSALQLSQHRFLAPKQGGQGGPGGKALGGFSLPWS